MTKKSGLFSRIRTRTTPTGRKAKFAAVTLGADLSSFVPAPQSLLDRLGIKKAFIPAGVRPSVRSTIVTPAMFRKARLEAEEGRTLSPPEVKRIRGAKKYTNSYLRQKLRFDPRLGDPSLFHPSFWNRNENFQQNWIRAHRRFLRLAQDRTGFRYDLTETGEWIKTPMPGASRKVMSDADWSFYTRHYFSNYDFYQGAGPELLELPPGEVSPRTIRRGRGPGRANQTGRKCSVISREKSRIIHHPTQPISDADAGADAEFVPSDEMSVEAVFRDAVDPPITELDIRMIAAGLYDQGRADVLADMIEGVTGVRPPDDAYSPRKLPIRNPEWRKARKKVKRKKCRAERRARMTDEEKAKQIGNLQLWKANNPDKMQVAESRRLKKKKAGRKSREFVAVDLEGFDTGKYFTDDRRDYARELHEGTARGEGEKELDRLLRDHIVISEEERLAQQVSFSGWTVHGRKWYLEQHDLTDDPMPSARNKKPGTPPIYIDHRPFLLGAGHDRHQLFLSEESDTGEEGKRRGSTELSPNLGDGRLGQAAALV